MTDKEKMIQMFTDLGIEFEIDEGCQLYHTLDHEIGRCDVVYLCHENTSVVKSEFEITFYFDKNGKFLEYLVW